MATGQARLLWARRPIESVIADPATLPLLRDQLEQVRAVRSFAESLGLSVGRRYRHYTPWPGDRVVTTIVSTRPGEIEPVGFWFPIVIYWYLFEKSICFKWWLDGPRNSKGQTFCRSWYNPNSAAPGAEEGIHRGEVV